MARTGENIYKRKDGRWEARYIKYYDGSGKAKYGYVYAHSYTEAKSKLIRCLTSISSGSASNGRPNGLKGFDFWLDEWLKVKKVRVKEPTYIRYRNSIENHIKPYLGKYPIERISTALIENFAQHLLVNSVILSALIDLIMMLPLGHNQNKDHFWTNNSGNLMTNLFVAIVSAIAGLLILNYFIKTSDIYHTIVSIIGSIIVVLSVGTIPMVIITLIRKKRLATVAVATGIGLLFLFSKSKIMGTLRSAVFKAIVYVGGIWILEKHFGSIANGMSFISSVFVAFGPVLVMQIGLYFIVKSMMA